LTESDLPAPVRATFGQSVREYWLDRVRQHTADRYADLPISKFPEDLRVYEHLIWISRANAVIEIGSAFGGSALWFRDRLAAFARYRPGPDPQVISIDRDIAAARGNIEATDRSFAHTIALVEADVTEPELPDRVATLLPPDSRCLVVEDSLHVYDTTLAALRGFARFVPVGGFFVVEDGCVDVEEMRASEDWPRGVLPALRDWLETPQGKAFELRRDLELYGITCHPEGFLQRVQPDRFVTPPG
jgi:cephalosporin hydroxylase